MTAFVAIALIIVVGTGTGVVLTRSPRRQVLAIAANGLALSILFMALRAPDVAYSEIVIGTAALPLLFLGMLVSLKTDEPRERR